VFGSLNGRQEKEKAVAIIFKIIGANGWRYNSPRVGRYARKDES
jgi:hypothetical protein